MKKLFESEFSKNLLTMITGTALAQLIPLIFIPILARIYPVHEHGTFTLYFTILTTLSVLATLRYELAIVLPYDDNEAKKIFRLSLVISLAISVLSFIIIIFFNKIILAYLNKENDIKFWIYFIPLSIFLNGLIQSQNYWLNREKKYVELTKSKIILSSVAVFIPLILSFFVKYSGILIISYIASQVLCLIYVYFIDKSLFRLSEIFDFQQLKQIAVKYKKFPLLNTPSTVVDQIASVIPLFFINKYFGLSMAAYYGMALKVVSVPSSFLSYSISQTLFKEIVNKLNNNESYFYLIKKAFINLTLLGLIPTLVFLFFGEFLFVTMLGSTWKVAGDMTTIICISAFVKFIISPLSITLVASNKLHLIAIWQIIYLVANFLIIFLVNYQEDVFKYLFFLMMCDVFVYIIYAYIILKASKKNY